MTKEQNPATESDISKAQSPKQPLDRGGQQQSPFKSDRHASEELSDDQAATGQERSETPDTDRHEEILAGQRSNNEAGASSGMTGGLSGQTGGQPGAGFIGSQGQQDLSGQLIEEDEEEDFAEDSQAAPEGK